MKSNSTNSPQRYFSQDDFRSLHAFGDLITKPASETAPTLRDELERSTVLAREELPPFVVVMDSRVRVRDVASGETEEYVITWPDRADGGRGRVSVLAPIGTALIGYRVGDEVTWPTPGGVRRLEILEVEPVPFEEPSNTAEDTVARILYGAR